MLTAAAAAQSSSPSSLSLGSSGPLHYLRCHTDPIDFTSPYGNSRSWRKSPFKLQRISEHSGLSFTSENPFFGTTQLNWLPLARDICVSQVSVASDYSDSVPDSSGYVTHNGYHPLEELRVCRQARETMPAPAEIARTAVEANNRALLIFPGIVHCEPHEQISWAEFQYVIDDFGDIFFEIYDEQNILQDQGASNPVTALIGMDMSHYESRKMDLFDDNILEIDLGDDAFLSDDYFEVEDSVDWRMTENSTWMHPLYFAKCLTKTLVHNVQAIGVEHAKFMDYPSNGVSVSGILRPTFVDEEFYLRRLFSYGDRDDFSDYKDGDAASFSSSDDESCPSSTIYILDITKIELFSVYGVQSVVSVQDFQYAEPDVLVHSSPSILEHFRERGTRSSVALKALCKKKGLQVERANLIGVDGLGMDVRVSSGTEVRTHRFSFKTRATSACAADKQIQQLLYPRSRRKKLRTLDKPTDVDSL